MNSSWGRSPVAPANRPCNKPTPRPRWNSWVGARRPNGRQASPLCARRPATGWYTRRCSARVAARELGCRMCRNQTPPIRRRRQRPTSRCRHRHCRQSCQTSGRRARLFHLATGQSSVLRAETAINGRTVFRARLACPVTSRVFLSSPLGPRRRPISEEGHWAPAWS